MRWLLASRFRVLLIVLGLLLLLDVGRSLYARVGYASPAETWQHDPTVYADLTWPPGAGFKANPGYLLLALLFFALSKIVAAVRLRYFFEAMGVHLSNLYNFRLYLIGMFHNLYLPGGVGGDGYKVYLLHKESKKPVKKLISAVLFDRINGLAALFFLALMLSSISSIRLIFEDFEIYGWLLLVLVYPVYLLVAKQLFPYYHIDFFKTTGLSLLTQSLQLVCTYFLLLSLGVAHNILEYQALFMLASILTIVPITFGGIGIREMVFIASYQMLGLEKETGVSFSLLFFATTALVSFTGAFLKHKPKNEEDIALEKKPTGAVKSS